MRTRSRFLLATLAALPALTACAESPTGSTEAPAFVATVRGSVRDDFRGSGWFHHHPGNPSPHVLPGAFSISSGTPLDPASFMLFREGPGLPGPGTYPLAATAAGSRRFVAVHVRRLGDVLEGFTSTGGELRITVSTPDRIEGTFRFGGIRNCSGTVTSTGTAAGTPAPGSSARLSCDHPIDPAQPAVEVTGSFVAVPAGAIPPRLP
jgi:hypothetical protein